MKKIILLLAISLASKTFSQNNALSFSAPGTDVELAYSPALDFNINDKITIEAWVKTTESYAAIIWSNHEDIMPFVGTEVAIVFGKAVFEMFNHYQNNGIRVETVMNTINDGNWHHLAFVYKGIPSAATCEIYIDGVSQVLNINTNNLSASPTTPNESHIGSRNNTTYHSNIVIDELRIWKRVLCAAEIQAHKNCSLVGNEPQLEAYYKFDQGIADGNNATVTTLIDSSPNAHTGTLTGFALSGTSSNWVSSTASISGACAMFTGGMSVAGSNTVCSGIETNLSASGALSYTWQPGNVNGSSITVSPSVSTTYTVYATSPANCLLVNTFSLTVYDCTGLNELQINYNVTVYPDPGTGKYTLKTSEENFYTIQIYSIQGTLLKTITFSGKQQGIDITEFSSGIYLFSIKDGLGFTKTIKVIKE